MKTTILAPLVALHMGCLLLLYYEFYMSSWLVSREEFDEFLGMSGLLGEKWEEDSGALLHGLDPALVLT